MQSSALPPQTPEHRRLQADSSALSRWRRWGPYVSDRSWGTVREDYSADGSAWSYLTHDHARSKAYRWGEDGIAALCDRYQMLLFSPVFWNGRDPILKERLFGLTPEEGNHGEDVKECYWYLDNLPTHAYMRFLYKYPHAAFPYAQLVEENKRRNGAGPEYELPDTGIFNGNRYFDVVIEYAKASEDDLVIRIEAFNRGAEDAVLHLLPHLWFRNTWSWSAETLTQPTITRGPRRADAISLVADDKNAKPPEGLPFEYRLGPRTLYGDPDGIPLFTDNETNAELAYGPSCKSRSPYTKDAFHRSVVEGDDDAVNPADQGTKACLHYVRTVPAGGSTVLRLRLTDHPTPEPLTHVDTWVTRRKEEADDFYAAIHLPEATQDERLVQRQAFAGLLWSKQIYLFDVKDWLDGDNPTSPPPPQRHAQRNAHWRHLTSLRILSMPDKWEYPWFAAWDLAFHAVTTALVDQDFAKHQLQVLLYEQFLHPGGQIPAYEWEFSDTNPPVHAWAVWRVYNMDRIRNGKADRAFLELCFHKLLINFAWWVNKVDRNGNNVFEGGFLGLDNITVVDRSAPLPNGATLEQSDATGWMGMFCLNMMRISLELARENPVYEGLAIKFFQHYVYLGAAIKQMGHELWDENDGFFYDVLHHPDGRRQPFRVRSLVGLIPLYAVERLERDWIEPFKDFRQNLDWLLANRPDLTRHCIGTVERIGPDGKTHVVHILTLVQREQLERIIKRVCDEDEFLSPYGLRSLSKAHETEPFVFGDRVVRYEPAESSEKLKGGNSNWRGPIWFPTAFLLIEALRKLGTAYGQQVTVADARGPQLTFWELAEELARRMTNIFLRDENGRRPVNGTHETAQTDPHWRDLIPFHEYFHGDTGAGLGASHQTGWTSLVASLIDEWRRAPQGAAEGVALGVRLRQGQRNGNGPAGANGAHQLDAPAVPLG